MAGFQVSVPHSVGRDAARDRVSQFIDNIQRDYPSDISNVRSQWSADRLEFGFAARGMNVEGTLVVEDDTVHVFGPLPLAAMFFRGKIEQTIRQELEKLLQ
jgi:hypothetical protein